MDEAAGVSMTRRLLESATSILVAWRHSKCSGHLQEFYRIDCDATAEDEIVGRQSKKELEPRPTPWRLVR